jgi:hypothetical protein
LSLSLGFVASLTASRSSSRGTPLPFGTGFDHRQRDAFPLLVDGHDPNGHDVTHTDNVVWTLDVAIGKLANVDQSGVFQSDIDKRAEIDHVEDSPLKLHAGSKILELEDTLLEDWFRQIVARIAFRSAKSIDDVVECELANI